MNILIAAAKTGGHVYPATEVSKEFINNGHKAIFLGTNNLIERNAIKDISEIQYEHIGMNGYRGNSILSKVLVLLSLPINVFKVLKILWNNKVDSIIVFGGFISIPAAIAGLILLKPIYVHEQNTVLGSANKIISKFSKKIFLGMPLHKKNLKRSEVIGNPIRKSFVSKIQNRTDDYVKIYITGGSQGAKYLNDNLPPIFNDINIPISIRHQCGKGKKPGVEKLYANFKEVEVKEFFDNPNSQIDWADFIISRAGALSLSEIISMKKGTLMIPLPNAVDNHQLLNARYIEKDGIGLVHEQEYGIDILKNSIKNIIETKEYLIWQQAEFKTNHMDAAHKIFTSVLENN